MSMSGIKQMIKEWMAIDAESAELKKRLRQFSAKKKEISEKLLVIMKDQKIDEFDLNTDGKLVRQTKLSKQSINKKNLPMILTSYYENEEEAVKVAEFILNSRPEKVVESIRKK
jgi:hypothetical protein